MLSSEVAAAAIESLSENLSDSVVAPLLAFRLGGLPLCAAYRLTNTADAMWGYRTAELEYSGKVAARADDLCVLRSLHTDNPNHGPAMFMMNNGTITVRDQ